MLREWHRLAREVAPRDGLEALHEAEPRAGAGDPAAVASGISEALITTAAGLIVGILIQFCYNFFANRIDKIIADMTEQTAAFIDLLAEREHEGA